VQKDAETAQPGLVRRHKSTNVAAAEQRQLFLLLLLLLWAHLVVQLPVVWPGVTGVHLKPKAAAEQRSHIQGNGH
jgi:hypothetical protein